MRRKLDVRPAGLQGAASMKTLLLGSAALFVLAGAANAADMPVKIPVKAPPVITYDWPGFYVGGFFGNSVEEAKVSTNPPGNPAGTGIGQLNATPRGGLR